MSRPELDIKQQLKKFIEQYRKRLLGGNTWLQDYHIKAYVRLAKHCIEGELKTSLDIAAVEVVEEHRRQGRFKDFLLYAHEINPRQVTYIECVNNPDLQSYLRREGWIEIDDILCFYKIKER